MRNLNEKSIPNGVGKFFTWLWCVFSQINEAKSTTENAVSIDKRTRRTRCFHFMYDIGNYQIMESNIEYETVWVNCSQSFCETNALV